VKDWIGLLARLVTGGVLVWAGALKLPEPRASVQAVAAYDLLPVDLVRPVGYLLPIVEVLVGALLLLGLLTRAAAAVAGLLMLAFVVGIASAWARGLEIDCGCFGGGGYDPDATSKYPWEIARDLGIAVLAGWLVIRPHSRFALDSVLFRPTADERFDDVQEVR